MEIGFDEFAAVETTRLLGLARVLCGNDHDAWDLTQETLARVSARWDRLAHHDNLPAYARTTLANLHRNARRRRREVLVAEPLDRAAAALEAGQKSYVMIDVRQEANIKTSEFTAGLGKARAAAEAPKTP